MVKSQNQQIKILVVEDDFFLIKVLQTKLINEGYQVEIAADGVLALETLKRFTPDLMLLDLVMPRKDGFEVLEEMSKDKKLSKIPVLVLTNLGQESDVERVKVHGVRDYLVKSDISIDSVVEKVRTTLKKR
jgi:two-component system alkaline phosphatase synthesis response regulator PhoP